MRHGFCRKYRCQHPFYSGCPLSRCVCRNVVFEKSNMVQQLARVRAEGRDSPRTIRTMRGEELTVPQATAFLKRLRSW
jgi:hypothetical protein